MPPEAINRLADNWRPLFAVAQVIGGHWPQRLVEAFKQLTARPQPEQLVPPTNGHPSPSVIANQLLTDVRQLFADAHTDRLFSSYLVRALHGLQNRPWAGDNNGSKPITVTALARYLSFLGIRSRTLRIGAETARGYFLSALVPLEPYSSQPASPDFQI
jgi:hypothetical protein